MLIGLVGEAPNDTQSIENLLLKKYLNPDFEYVFLLDRINGSQLDSQKTKRFLRIEYEDKKPEIVVFIRDLDSVLPNKTKVTERKNYFTQSNSVVDKKGVFLLHIYEIEALILADSDTFNRLYDCELPTVSNTMKIEEPKEYLKSIVNKYCESDNAEIFQEMDFEKALDCQYFSEFITKFEKAITAIKT